MEGPGGLLVGGPLGSEWRTAHTCESAAGRAAQRLGIPRLRAHPPFRDRRPASAEALGSVRNTHASVRAHTRVAERGVIYKPLACFSSPTKTC